MWDVVVLGCGVSGITAARLLSEKNQSVAVIDEYSSPGGNHISHDFGPYTFDIGTIVFWSDGVFKKYFPEVADTWMPVEYDVQRLAPSGEILKYPFDIKGDILAKPLRNTIRVVGEIIFNRLKNKKDKSLSQFLDYYLGKTLIEESGLENYIRRFYGLPIEEVAFEFAASRMNWVVENASVRRRLAKSRKRFSNLLKPKLSAPMSAFVRPRKGFASLYQPVVDALEKKGVKFSFGSPIQSIARIDGGFEIRTLAKTFRSSRVIASIPLELIGRMLGEEGFSAPPSIPLMTLCVRFRGERSFSAPVLYNFHGEGAWKRLTMHSDWYGPADGWDYFGVEVPMINPDCTAEKSFLEFEAMVSQLGIFGGQMDLVGSFKTDFAYPLYDRLAKERSVAVRGRLHELGIETIGRQGNFDYIPSSEIAIEKTRKAI